MFKLFHFLTENGHITDATKSDIVEGLVILEIHVNHLLQIVCHVFEVNRKTINRDVVRIFTDKDLHLIGAISATFLDNLKEIAGISVLMHLEFFDEMLARAACRNIINYKKVFWKAWLLESKLLNSETLGQLLILKSTNKKIFKKIFSLIFFEGQIGEIYLVIFTRF